MHYKVSKISIFKNGLSLIECQLDIESPGEYAINEIINPIHGSLWYQEVDGVDLIFNNFDKRFDKSNLYKLPESSDLNIELKYIDENNEINTYNGSFYGDGYRSSGFKVNGTEDIIYLNNDRIISTKVSTPNNTINIRPSLIVRASKKAKIAFRYLTKGVLWSPSYLINIINNTEIEVTFKAVIKNQLKNIDANVAVVSGLPNFEFTNVRSLFSKTTIDEFFNELTKRNDSNLDRNQCTPPDSDSEGVFSGELSDAKSDSEDLVYSSIGNLKIDYGQSIIKTISKSICNYERVIDWMIQDSRNSDGVINYSKSDNIITNGAWDSLKLRNPFEDPITAAPVQIEENGQFRGQSLTFWANPNEEILLRVTSALSVKTRTVETEKPNSRDLIRWGGAEYQESIIEGELIIQNRRNSNIKMLIRKRITGKYIKSSEEVMVTPRADGVRFPFQPTAE